MLRWSLDGGGVTQAVRVSRMRTRIYNICMCI